MEVSFFPGCTAHSTGVEYSLSTKSVLDELGVELKEIDDWNCCGAAAAHCLSKLLGLALPARNVAKAQQMDLPLAVPCPGCFNSFKRAQHALTHDPEMKEQLEEIVDFKYKGTLEVKAMHEVVLDHVGIDKIKAAVKRPLEGLKVASYYGCALVRNPKIVSMGDYENPVFLDEVVTAIGGEAMDWSYKTDCCSADLAMTHGHMAVAIADKIMGGAVEAGADCVMSACGLCQINLDMRQSGKKAPKLPVFYFTELMGTAMDVGDREHWWSKHIVNPRPLLKSKNLA